MTCNIDGTSKAQQKLEGTQHAGVGESARSIEKTIMIRDCSDDQQNILLVWNSDG